MTVVLNIKRTSCQREAKHNVFLKKMVLSSMWCDLETGKQTVSSWVPAQSNSHSWKLSPCAVGLHTLQTRLGFFGFVVIIQMLFYVLYLTTLLLFNKDCGQSQIVVYLAFFTFSFNACLHYFMFHHEKLPWVLFYLFIYYLWSFSWSSNCPNYSSTGAPSHPQVSGENTLLSLFFLNFKNCSALQFQSVDTSKYIPKLFFFCA